MNFAESIETVTANLREVQPTLFFAVPRIWERLHALVTIKSGDATRFKRVFLKFTMALARRIGRMKVANGGSHTALSRLLYVVGQPLVFRALKERIGLRRCRFAGNRGGSHRSRGASNSSIGHGGESSTSCTV